MKKSTKRALRTLVQLLCIVVMLAAAVWIVFLLRQEDESRSYADNLAQEVVRTVSVEPSAQPPTAPSPTEEAPQFDELSPISVDFDALDGTDIVAWLYCEEPSGSYAVVQGKDIVLAPHFTKEDVVIITGKIGGKVPQLLPPCGLDNFNGFFRLIISCIHGKCISCSQKSYPGQGDKPGC